MNEPKKPAPTPEEYPLVLSYLREDIQDMRQEGSDFRKEVRQEFNGVRQEIGAARQAASQEIGAARQAASEELHREAAALRQEMAEMARRFESRLNWVITSLIGVGTLVVASAGVVVAMLRP